MSYDPVDVFGGAVGTLFKRLGYAVTVIVAGAIIGFIPLVATFLVDRLLSSAGPNGSASGSKAWLLLDFLTLVAGYACLVKWDKAGYRGWIFLVGTLSLVLRLAGGGVGWLPHLAGWTVWLVLLAAAAAGSWFIHQWNANRLALHLARVNAENAHLKAKRDAHQRTPEYTVPPAPPAVEVKRLESGPR